MATKITGMGEDGLPTTSGDTGVMEIDGSLTLGNADTDNVVFKAEINSHMIPNTNNEWDLGSSSKIWSGGYFQNLNVSDSIVVSSSTTNAELIRLQKGETDTRYMVFESEGVDKFEMYLNSFENFIFTTTDTTDDILFRLNGHTAIYMDGSPKQVRIWDSFNSAYSTEINSELEISGETSFQKLTSDKASIISGATGTITHDCSNGSIFFHESISGNFNADFTNFNLGAGFVTNIVLFLEQGGTAYMCEGVKIGGSGQTIMWEGGGGTPSGTSGGLDRVNFEILYDGTGYLVMGSVKSY